ncbi:uncharacterized protein LOC126846770 [Adelges cooleyi]|uniref:uncharacterized protein LOC126846770 n=1 Tax=Adelges cooleyi TaxID=133065 RepID=UPI00218041C3|nr:uncharacterized protein LOC126846770 [Adelges cooleyi]
MEDIAFIKFLILLILAFQHNETIVCANLPKILTNTFNHIKQERHWQGTWFSEYKHEGEWKPKDKIGVSNSKFLVSDRLPLVSPMMGCAYGPNLNRFLMLTLEAIDECAKLQKKNHKHAGDCKDKLEQSIARGKYVILKLMHTLIFIDPESHKTMNNNRFYNVLVPLYDFVMGQVPVEFSGIIPGGLTVYQLLNGVADALRELVFFTCLPKLKMFNIQETKNEYNGDPNDIYTFYISKLNTYISYICGHLIQLGFHYSKTTDRITFDLNRSG